MVCGIDGLVFGVVVGVDGFFLGVVVLGGECDDV